MNRNFLIMLFLWPLLSLAQVKNIGTPLIRNYTKTTYNGGTQNWNISQDQKGFMYFANNDGILRFDGYHWEFLDINIPLPVRSVFVDSKDRIFVGAIDNFGILETTPEGKYHFKSLRHLYHDDIGFSDVWRIHEINNNIVFQSFEKLLIYDNNTIEIFKPKEKYRFSFKINDRLLVQEYGLGLYEYLNGSFKKVPWSDPLAMLEILSILPISENRLLIGTTSGFYQYFQGQLMDWESEVNDFINKNKLFCSVSVIGNHLAFGTILNGLIISDINGNIVQHLSRDAGLQNNTILSLFSDKDNNLWLGLDNGIDYVEINSPISFVSDGGDIGTGYCCIIHNDRLYLGTNQGLLVKPFSNFPNNSERFKLIENTEGQVWSLTIINDMLICGHNFGTFLIEDDVARKIDSEPGGWKYLQTKTNPDIVLAGFYSGLAVFKITNQGLKFHKKLEGLRESSRFILEDNDGNFWISHGGKGVFKVTFNEQLDSILTYRLFNVDDGLPSNEQNIVLSYNGQEYVSTINGLYQYNKSSSTFSASEEMRTIFGDVGRIKTIKTDYNNNVWYIADNESGVLRRNEDLTYTKITSPFKNLQSKYVSEFEFVYPLNNDHVFLGIDDGFAHYSTKFPKSYVKDFHSYITKIEFQYLDSILFPLNVPPGINYEFPYKKNSIRFHYTSPFYENLVDLRFSYFLENFSDEWSPWSTDIYKDFTNLPFGNYRFKIKALNNYGLESEPYEFGFTILPPWYKSSLAYGMYIFLTLVLIVTLILTIRLRVKRSKEKEKLKHQLELQKKEELFQHQAVVKEKEIIKLRNEKLRSEMIHRDKELANQTNNIIQKNRFLMKLNQELHKITKETSDGLVKTKMVVLKKRITKEIDNKQQNKIFETYFDEVHNDFFERLKNQYPQLSPKDLRLCAYIKMNISTKEIATLLNISDRGVEISRYRLRKKMEISRDVNLSTFLSGI